MVTIGCGRALCRSATEEGDTSAWGWVCGGRSSLSRFQARVTALRSSTTPGRRESGSVSYVLGWLGGKAGLSGMRIGGVRADGSGERDLAVVGGEDVMDEGEVEVAIAGRYVAPPMAGTRP